MIQVLNDNFDNPQLKLIKAIDPESGDITAMAAWQLMGYDPEELGRSRLDVTSTFTPPLPLKAGIFQVYAEGQPPSKLVEYISLQMTAFLDTWSRDVKHIYLALLMADPIYQRRGIGTAMLKWGHDQADKDKVPAVLIATPVGHPLYSSMGWKEISTPLQVDLKDWVSYAKNGDQGWGVYKYYYHLRLPKTIT